MITNLVKQRIIWSPLVVLVPYRKHHVPKYNRWMQSDELQYLTGSEPLTLDDEYKMLESWNQDPNKLTFIVLDREIYDSLSEVENVEQRETMSMIGDVNLYVNGDVHDDDDEIIAEIEIMIAEPTARGKGRGKEATVLMLKLAYEVLKFRKFQAKIKTTNVESQKLFSDVLGFRETKRCEVFDEITFVCDLSSKKQQLQNHPLMKLFQRASLHQ